MKFLPRSCSFFCSTYLWKRDTLLWVLCFVSFTFQPTCFFNLLSLFLLFTLGIPHGAIDHVLFFRSIFYFSFKSSFPSPSTSSSSSSSWSTWSWVKSWGYRCLLHSPRTCFFSVYLFFMLCHLYVWSTCAWLAFTWFLLFTMYHFGISELRFLSPSSSSFSFSFLTSALIFSRGAILVTWILIHPNPVIDHLFQTIFPNHHTWTFVSLPSVFTSPLFLTSSFHFASSSSSSYIVSNESNPLFKATDSATLVWQRYSLLLFIHFVHISVFLYYTWHLPPSPKLQKHELLRNQFTWIWNHLGYSLIRIALLFLTCHVYLAFTLYFTLIHAWDAFHYFSLPFDRTHPSTTTTTMSTSTLTATPLPTTMKNEKKNQTSHHRIHSPSPSPPPFPSSFTWITVLPTTFLVVLFMWFSHASLFQVSFFPPVDPMLFYFKEQFHSLKDTLLNFSKGSVSFFSVSSKVFHAFVSSSYFTASSFPFLSYPPIFHSSISKWLTSFDLTLPLCTWSILNTTQFSSFTSMSSSSSSPSSSSFFILPTTTSSSLFLSEVDLSVSFWVTFIYVISIVTTPHVLVTAFLDYLNASSWDASSFAFTTPTPPTTLTTTSLTSSSSSSSLNSNSNSNRACAYQARLIPSSSSVEPSSTSTHQVQFNEKKKKKI